MPKPNVLLQLDSDEHASSFDAIVATDCDVDQLLQYHRVQPEQVQSLVHGAIFTRGVKDLNRTAIFVGGTDVQQGERLLDAVRSTFFGPMRVSVMLDANGANTTAAAAVWSAAQHVDLSASTVVVLAATGAVGQRVVRLLAPQCATIHVGSRSVDRAAAVCERVAAHSSGAELRPLPTDSAAAVAEAVGDADALIAAGAAGVQLLDRADWEAASRLKVAIDLNAVPPLGIEGVGTMDRGEMRGNVACYGAIGVGGTKMKLHKAAIRQLFSANDQVLDAEEIWQIAADL